jgi:hypothetical protein
MSFFIGKYFQKTGGNYAKKTYNKALAKVVDKKADGDFILIDILTGGTFTASPKFLGDYFVICPSTKLKEDGAVDLVCARNYTFYVKDFYLHRVGGPAFVSEKEKKYFLIGKEIGKEDYLEMMPEKIQTDMVFNVDEL